MQETITLTPFEQRAFDKGLATIGVRIKAGRMVWDRMEGIVPEFIIPSKERDASLDAFRRAVEKVTYQEKMALKEWLEAQLKNECEDMLGNADLHEQLSLYAACLQAISDFKG